MNEASKTKALWGPTELALLKGEGIDIGCGSDPIAPTVRKFDLAQGDANEIGNFVSDRFGYVFSAHCLEHMKDPMRALAGSWRLVRPDGHLIVLIPDEDLYEQRYWPSLFNSDHKSTFTIAKQSSWSPRSFNVLKLMQELPDAEIVSIKAHNHGYDRRFLHSFVYPHFLGSVLARGLGFVIELGSRCKVDDLGKGIARLLQIPIDQTQKGAFAQIQAIVRRKEV